MFLLILKSSVCLAVFMLFYKLFLEKESVHHFKRFYLLGALLVSMVIPFITITEYVQVKTIQEFMPFQPIAFTDAVVEKTIKWQDYIPAVLWSIYALGVIIFSIRFLKNLVQLFQKIKTNPKYKNQNYIHVLLVDLVHPHTFFNYIFLNKNKYEHNCIPNEVLLHEQTHAKQKHALDILFLEVLHIIFWFNPLLYFIKKDIKLNHEFLADQAVLKQGVDTKNYQQLLLAFTSPDNYRDARTNQLANAINYSLIKKRFTVMKTQTSKKAFWLKGLLILPIVAILIYSFSEKEIVEKEMASLESLAVQEETTQSDDLKSYNEKLKLYESLRLEKPHFIHRKREEQKQLEDNYRSVINTFLELNDKDKKLAVQPIVHSSPYLSSTKEKNGKTKYFRPWEVPEIYSKGNNLIITNSIKDLEKNISSVPTLSQINYIYGNFGYVRIKNEVLWFCIDESLQLRLFNKKGQWLDKEGNITSKTVSIQQKATPKQITEYNRIVKKLMAQPVPQRIIKQKDVERIKYIYGLMTDEQKKNAEAFPKLAPPPPPPTSNIQHEVVSKTYENASEALLNAKKEFEIKAKTYGKAIKIYKREGKGDLAKLLTLHSEAKKLHSNFSILAKKEKLIPPPPFPPAPKPAKVEKAREVKETTSIVKTNTNKNIILLEHWYITIDDKKYYYPYKKGDLKKYYDKYGNKVTLDIVKEYKNKNTTLEKLINEGKHYIHKTEKEKQEIDQLFSDLGGMYFRMAKANKTKVNRPKSPVFPYIKLTKKTGKVYYKKRNELTEEDKKLLPSSPPPPPPPVMKKAVDNMGNYSKELQKAWKAFKTEGDKYGNAVNSYLINKEGKINALKVQYKEVMKLYNVYIKIAKNEKAHTVPPPPPPAQAPSKKQ